MERKNLWAPWRIKYIEALAEKGECFVCRYHKDPARDKANLVLWRTRCSIVVLNKFPYNNGHLLISPSRHIPTLDDVSDDELLELIKLCRDCQKVLTAAISPHGFNVGMNFGRCAGAGLPDHTHIHIVPRWDGDTNFMPVCSDTDVISQSLTELYELLKQVSVKENLPNL